MNVVPWKSSEENISRSREWPTMSNSPDRLTKMNTEIGCVYCVFIYVYICEHLVYKARYSNTYLMITASNCHLSDSVLNAIHILTTLIF